MPGIVPVSDFSGLVSSTCALARAAAIVPIDSLDRCMTALHDHEVEADRPGLRALGPDPMAIRFLGVLRHERLELALSLLMLDKGWSRSAIDARELGPGVRLTHVDRPHRLDARPRWLNAEEARGLAGLDAAPEFLLGREQKVLIERVGVDLDLDPLPATGNDRQSRTP